MNEVIVITGSRGVGKTLLASTYLPPSQVGQVYYHDSENSANRVVQQLAASGLAFGRYVDLKARFSDLPGDDDLLARINAGKLPWVSEKAKSSLAAYYEHVLADLAENLIPGKYKLYIHDTLEKVEAGMAAWVETHKKVAGVTSVAFGKLWTEGVYPLYEHLLASIFDRGVETVILCSHLKTPWSGNRPVVGKVVPSGKKLLYRLSSLMLWLVRDARVYDGAPAALVLKERMGSLTTDKDGWSIHRMLPERVPHCTWVDVRQYLEIGCNLSQPADGETMSQAERDMISELLTDEQMRLMILAAEQDLAEVRQEAVLLPQQEAFVPDMTVTPMVQTVQDLIAQGMTAERIAEVTGKALPVVKAMIG